MATFEQSGWWLGGRASRQVHAMMMLNSSSYVTMTLLAPALH